MHGLFDIRFQPAQAGLGLDGVRLDLRQPLRLQTIARAQQVQTLALRPERDVFERHRRRDRRRETGMKM